MENFAEFQFTLYGEQFKFSKPVFYKNIDPVKGELHQPQAFVSPLFINLSPNVILFKNGQASQKKQISISTQSNTANVNKTAIYTKLNGQQTLVKDTTFPFLKGSNLKTNVFLDNKSFANNSSNTLTSFATVNGEEKQFGTTLKKISYDHIPDIIYHYNDAVKVLKLDVKTVGKKAGYIAGAGDKIPEALVQLDYEVTTLNEQDITAENLKQFDVIVTGVRAYNVHNWLSKAHATLMQYIQNGGVLFVQYNTNSNAGPMKGVIAPFSFNISRGRITDETATVNFLQPKHDALNFPNKITATDFEGWVQERSIYHAEKIDSSYAKILSMKDPGEAEQDGSLIVAKYGKGKFVYTGLVFFRELPAAVPGAYRLFANLIAKPRK
jgi:hypothetical protein